MHASTQVHLEDVIENKRPQTQKFCVLSLSHSTFVKRPEQASFKETGSRIMVMVF